MKLVNKSKFLVIFKIYFTLKFWGENLGENFSPRSPHPGISHPDDFLRRNQFKISYNLFIFIGLFGVRGEKFNKLFSKIFLILG